MTTRKKQGFTLIELLVVIAIIAILAAILFPVFAKAREKARQASCMSNHKQMGLAALQYVQDYDETFPVVYCCPASGTPVDQSVLTSTVGYFYQLIPYMKSRQSSVCPSTEIRFGFNLAWWGSEWGLWGVYRPNVSSTPIPGAKLSAMKAPASVVNFWEVGNPARASFGMGQGCFLLEEQSAPNMPDGRVNPWYADKSWGCPHNDGGNITLADGHTKWYNNKTMPAYTDGGYSYAKTWTAMQISFDRSYDP